MSSKADQNQHLGAGGYPEVAVIASIITPAIASAVINLTRRRPGSP